MGDHPTAVLFTPDGRYLIVRGRLWRAANPNLAESDRKNFVAELMDARRAIKHDRDDSAALAKARRRVHLAKVALGERGPVWWSDGAPDLNRKPVTATPYAAWFAALAGHMSPEHD
ncbi:hypothetical protein [Lysobacter capsici]|uniref:hypothetical protein n=1 Tax=Lysobacter capsici TaxID=435897 RepID=UPI00287B8BC5|nr:hypothetical protein [Lysobacter capsici]WND80472.1 hypothetical protein RJ610_24885 [Lysobacter capsici]WND85669.1 hypothetical protein RJ609_24905 [Lysobacter capsici]